MFGKPRAVVEAVEQVMHLQCTAGEFQKSPYSTKQVVFDDEPPTVITDELTGIDHVVQCIRRRLQQINVSPAPHNDDVCFSC